MAHVDACQPAGISIASKIEIQKGATIMSRKKPGVDAKDNATLLKFVDGNGSSQIAAEELLDEIDNLALLLHEVRKQTDRIEAAADAIGDAILKRLDPARAASPSSSRTSGRVVSSEPKTSVRLRTLLPRVSQITDVQP
jgi:hypothetical protein